MAVLSVLHYPHPLLETRCEPAAVGRHDISSLVRDLVDTMGSFPGCVGISAPQVGRLLRIIAFDVSRHGKPPKNNGGLTVMINPRVLARQGQTINREGCLSLPDFTGNVARAERVQVAALDSSGEIRVYDLEGFEAVVFQHEYDHLDGILFINRITSIRTNLFTRKKYS